jgi:hypothetical protein
MGALQGCIFYGSSGRMRSRLRDAALFGLSLLVLGNTIAFCKSDALISVNVKSSSGNPLSDAIIKIFKAAHQGETFFIAKSDKYGFFRKANLTPGTYYLQVSRKGFEPVTTAKFAISPGGATALDIVLQDFVDYFSKDDPRNWDLKTVMRSSSERRLVFRNQPDQTEAPETETASKASFDRIGAVNLASNASLNSENYLIRPQAGQNSVTSNFAFTEPINQRSRMIISGQADFGYNSFWKLRNEYHYRPDCNHDYKISAGYSRMNISPAAVSAKPSQFFEQNPNLPESGVQTLAFGMEGTTKFLDMLSVRYGLDYSRLHYAGDRSFTYPSLQILVTPLRKWSFKSSFSSKRVSDTNSIILPDGEQLNLSEPTIITIVGDRVSMTQVRHAEISAERAIDPSTAIEFAVYNDQTRGPGLPIQMTIIAPAGLKTSLIELNEDHSNQQGARITVNRKLLDFIKGSVAYVYGEAASISNVESIAGNKVVPDLIRSFARQRYYHSITGKVNAKLEATQTNLMATVRWHPGNPVTPIDWFSDRMDIGTKSVNLELRQRIPTSTWFGSTDRWEALIDLRNIFNQGREVMPTSDGEIVLNRNPRSLRFGFSLNFH